MTHLPRLCLILLLSLGSPAIATAQDDPAEWIEKLASDKLSVRKQAEEKLWQAGTKALPALENALLHKQPEIAIRAQKILHYLQLGLSPDSPKELVELAQGFEKLSIEGKQNALQTLKQQRHFRIALLLFQRVKDNNTKFQLRDSVSGLAIVAAREALIAGDEEGALRFLTDFPDDPKNQYALAWVARSQGTLDSEIAKARASKDPEQWRYLLALLRIKGDRTGVLLLAEKHNLVELAAAFELLDGKPDNWLRWSADRVDSETRDIARAYTSIAIDRLNQRKDNANQLNSLIKIALRESDYTRRWAAIHALYALGHETNANKAVQSLSPTMLFSSLAEREKIDDALKAFNLDPIAPDYGALIDRNMKLIIEDEDSDEMDAVSTLIAFLEKRGISDPIEKNFLPRMLELAEANNERFTELLAMCFTDYSSTIRPAPDTAIKIASAYAKEDDLLWGTMIRIAFSENSYYTQWWEWLGELYPEDKRPDRFHKMMVLFRGIPDRKGEIPELDELIKEALDDDKPEDAETHRKLLALLSAVTRSTQYSLWSLKDESELDTDDLMNLERWEPAALKWEKAIEEAPQSVHAIIWAAVCWHKAGNAAKAQEWEKRFETLILGDSSLMFAASAIYKHVGMTEKALAWQTIALNCSARDETWHITLYTLAEDQLLTGQWQRAIAGYEAYILHTMAEGDTSTITMAFRARKKADMARAFALYQKQPKVAIALLRDSHQSLLTDASLADQFFPALRLIGAKSEHDAWFEESWQHFMKISERFPNDDNIRNSASWLAARCLLRLDDAEKEVTKALIMRPNQGAYLDTVAEIWFARNNREKAIEWSKKAITAEPSASSLRGQYHRFVQEPFPR